MEGAGAEAENFLGQSKRLLHERDFSNCRKYAMRALQSDPNIAGADQILAVADVLLASKTSSIRNNPNDGKNPNPNHYSILQLSSFTEDSKIIRDHFKKLVLILQPTRNKFSFADEAFELVWEAWSVLSSPTKKAQFDNELEKFYLQQQNILEEEEEVEEEEGAKNGSEENGSFWTACPYCYYVYEYERMYVDCCLRCQNCRRAFHGVVIPSPPSLAVDGKDKYYCCLGFFPIGYSWEGEKGTNAGPTEDNNGGGGVGLHEFVEISDGSEDSSGELDSGKKETGEAVQVDGTKICEEKSDGIEFGMQGIKRTEAPNVTEKKRPMTRRKTVARNAKKVLGRGNRVKRVERMPAAVEGGNEESYVIDGVEYVEGDDDILVGLEFFDDGGNEKVDASS